ncbi:MAG: hypothetical protein H6Q43_760 [Deltaproteobacteria bacterium]|nr:hypothetical protein [Deltaproteobacteria bacterium]
MEITVVCSRCGEVIRARIDLANDLSAEYGEGDQETSYLCRKVLIGKQGCYAPVEILLDFDAGRKIIDRKITGGKFAEEDEIPGKMSSGKDS